MRDGEGERERAKPQDISFQGKRGRTEEGGRGRMSV